MDLSTYCVQVLVTVIAFIGGCLLLGKILDAITVFLVTRSGRWLINATFLGVFHHELSHALFALLTGAKINSITLFRISHKDGKLGEVKFTPRGLGITQAVQVVLTSIAPMITGVLSLWGLIGYAIPWAGREHGVWVSILLSYLAFSIFMHMSLSGQDIKNIFSKFLYLFPILFIVFFLFNVNLPQAMTGEHSVAPIKELISAIKNIK